MIQAVPSVALVPVSTGLGMLRLLAFIRTASYLPVLDSRVRYEELVTVPTLSAAFWFLDFHTGMVSVPAQTPPLFSASLRS
jgi:hypothetical protein